MQKIIKAFLETVVIMLVITLIILFALVLAWVKFQFGIFLYSILFFGFIFLFVYYAGDDNNNAK